MRRAYSWAVLAGLGCVCAAAPASPHHAFSVAFDLERPVTVQGVITDMKWENPHSWIYVEVTRSDGMREQWQFETQPPNTLRRTGLRADMLKPGAQVTIKGYGAQNRAVNVGAASVIVFANGESFRIAAGGTPPPKD